MTVEQDEIDSDRFAQAEQLYEAGEFRYAGELWASIEKNGTARFNAGNAYRDAGDPVCAIQNYRAALEVGESDAYLNLALVLFDEGLNDEALEILEQGATAGDAQSAVQLAFEVLERDPLRAEELSEPIAGSVSVLGVRATVALAKARFAQNKGDNAINSLLSTTVPLEARVFVADFLADVGRGREAIQIYRELLDAGVKEAGVPLGNLLVEQKDAAGAESAYVRGAQLGDNFARFNLGVLLVDQGRIEEGRQLIEAAAEHGDPLARAWLANGRS